MSTILLVANQTLASPALIAAVVERLERGQTSFHVVVPTTPIPHRLTWDEGETLAAASERLESLLARLRELGADASGEIGSMDPVAAVRDAVRIRPVVEIILSTLPAGRSRWLRQDVASRIASVVDVKVTLVIAPRQLTTATA